MEIKNNNFGTWLKDVLISRGWSQAELARRANLSKSAINGVIKGTRNPGRDFIIVLAKALTLPPEELLYAMEGGTNYNSLSIEYAEWIQIYREADVDLRRELLDLARYWLERKKRKRGKRI